MNLGLAVWESSPPAGLPSRDGARKNFGLSAITASSHKIFCNQQISIKIKLFIHHIISLNKTAWIYKGKNHINRLRAARCWYWAQSADITNNGNSFKWNYMKTRIEFRLKIVLCALEIKEKDMLGFHLLKLSPFSHSVHLIYEKIIICCKHLFTMLQNLIIKHSE